MSALLESNDGSEEISSDLRVSLIYTMDESDTDLTLDSYLKFNWKCVEDKLMTFVVEGDVGNYKLTIKSTKAEEDTLLLNEYNNNYYYHPSVGIIQETTMTDCILSETGSDVRVLRIKEGSCILEGDLDGEYNPNFQGEISLNLNDLSNLIYLIVEDNNQFQTLNTFDLTGLQYLEGVKIGRNCFNYQKNTTPKKRYGARKFRITNCPRLTEIHIGNYSFSDFSGEFTLSGLNSLTSLYIGQLAKPSFNFYRAKNFYLLSTFDSISL